MNTAKKLITLLTMMLACISLNAQVTTFDDTCTCPPQFPGGDAELIQFLNENIQYPAQAARDKIEGKVVVQFMVKKTGKIDKVKVLRSVRKDLDKEAVRVIKMMPDFVPGKQNGETVDMLYTVPVTFKLFDEMEPLTVSEGSDVPDDFQPPMFPGGDRALMEFLKENVKYPPMAAKRKTQGRVVMTFVVDKTGKVSEIKVAKSVDIYLDTEAIRVCKLLPDFIPARQNGEPVSVWFTLPITFKL
jgi:TonB family protein